MRSRGLLALVICFSGGAALAEDAFSFPPPQSPTTEATLWATQYYVHLAQEDNSATAVPLTNRNGQSHGVSIHRSDWCDAAMEGTVAVRTNNNTMRVFNFDRLGSVNLTDCSQRFPKVSQSTKNNIRKSTFLEVTTVAPFGLGAPGYRLVPFRTVAVDKSHIQLGTVLFIPSLKGAQLKMPDGRSVVHDGYVFAGDTGNEIRGNHIDLFTGTTRTNPVPHVVRSNPARTFSAYPVTDGEIIQSLTKLHKM